jgi:hypothetical protein
MLIAQSEMKKILIIYYSQTGQIKEIVDSVTAPLKKDNQLFFEELKPVPAYPFPWSSMSFFQVFPESVREIPCELEPFKNDPDEDYNLVILAYQVWYLSPSIPVSSFLQSETAKKIFKGKPVITVIGVRNMWIMAQERVKSRINELGGRLDGNIVLADPAPNLVSVITIVRWLINGEKGAFKWLGKQFPPAGVPQKEIEDAASFGTIINESLSAGNYNLMQEKLVQAGAVKVDPVLMNIEKRGKMMFGIWAKIILKKGPYNDPAREGRLKVFKYYLFMVIYLISPIVSGLFRLIFLLNPRAASHIRKRYGLGGCLKS